MSIRISSRPPAAVRTAEPPDPGARIQPDGRAGLIASFLAISCTSYILTGGGQAGADYQLRWAVDLGDLLLALIAIVHLPDLRHALRDRRRHLCSLAALVLAISFVP